MRNGDRESLSFERAATDGRNLSSKSLPGSSAGNCSRSIACPSSPARVVDGAGSSRWASSEEGAEPQKPSTEERREASVVLRKGARCAWSEGEFAAAQEDDLPDEEKTSQIDREKHDDLDHKGISERRHCPAGGDGPEGRGHREADPTRRMVGKGMRVVEVTDLFRTMKGLKCTLTEAYACCFDRMEKVCAGSSVFLSTADTHDEELGQSRLVVVDGVLIFFYSAEAFYRSAPPFAVLATHFYAPDA